MKSFKKMVEVEKRKAIEEHKNDLVPISYQQLMNTQFPPSQWLVDQLVPLEGITIISGSPGSFKTWMILQMATDIAQEKPFLGQYQTKLGNILMIDEESHQRFIQERLLQLGVPDNLPIHFLSQSEFLVTDNKCMTDVLEHCKELKIDTVFIDSLVRIHRGKENDAGDMADVFRAIRTFCKEKMTVIMTHHERKEGASGKSSAQSRMRGSSDIPAAIDAHLAISRVHDDEYRLILEQSKNRQAMEIDPFEVRIHVENDKIWFEHMGTQDGGKNKKESAKETIPDILFENPDGLSKADVVRILQQRITIGQKNAYDALRELITEGVVVQEKRGKGNSQVCYLSPKEDEVSDHPELVI